VVLLGVVLRGYFLTFYNVTRASYVLAKNLAQLKLVASLKKKKLPPLSLSRREKQEKLKNSARRKTRFIYMLREQLPTDTTFKKLYNASYDSTRDERSLSSSHR